MMNGTVKMFVELLNCTVTFRTSSNAIFNATQLTPFKVCMYFSKADGTKRKTRYHTNMTLITSIYYTHVLPNST